MSERAVTRIIFAAGLIAIATVWGLRTRGVDVGSYTAPGIVVALFALAAVGLVVHIAAWLWRKK